MLQCIHNKERKHPTEGAKVNENMEILELMKLVDATPARSAWKKGVKEYAIELLDQHYKDTVVPMSVNELKEWLLNGAKNWNEYSWGGCSLIYDSDIAERLCNPSELKKTDNGRRRPNSRKSWLDTQTRALYQAQFLIERVLAGKKVF